MTILNANGPTLPIGYTAIQGSPPMTELHEPVKQGHAKFRAYAAKAGSRYRADLEPIHPERRAMTVSKAVAAAGVPRRHHLLPRRWRLQHDRVRAYDVVRSAHLERAKALAPADILFRDQRYDFDPMLAEGLSLRRVSSIDLFLTLLLNPVAALEVNEPLQRGGLPRSALAVASVRVAGWLRRKPVKVVTYAIENRDPYVDPATTFKSRVRRVRDLTLSRMVAAQLDRVVFGTTGAERVYRRRIGMRLPSETLLVPALPSKCECVQVAASIPKSVIFVGALQDRKGVRQLMEAWPEVLREHESARLTIIGKGALEPEVRAFASRQPSVAFLQDPPRARIHAELRQHDMLVLMSQPAPGWREQVGLPIVEGLAHGCRIVASTETGIADWLADHDHVVLDPGCSPTELGSVIADSLAAHAGAGDVIRKLPRRDGRMAADDLLMARAT